MTVSVNLGSFFGCPCYKNPTALGPMLRPLVFGSSHIGWFMLVFLLSLVLGWKTAMFQLSGFYCRLIDQYAKYIPKQQNPSYKDAHKGTPNLTRAQTSNP